MKKVLSLALCLVMVLSLVLPTAVFAEETTTSTSGMVVNKTAVANKDGTYTITLEAYGTGDKVTTTVTNEKPTDIVLVLDQSGSMAQNNMSTVSYEPYEKGTYGRGDDITNNAHYARRHNGGSANLWHKVGNKYYSVSVTVQTVTQYNKITSGKNNPTQNSATNYWNSRDNLYAKVNGEYLKVTVTRDKSWGTWYYTYKLSNGTVIASESRGNTASPTFTGTDDGYLYLLSEDSNSRVYTYTYTDDNGVTQTIGTSTGANTEFGTTLYRRSTSSSGTTRLQALKNAAYAFAESVAKKTAGADGIAGTADDVNHRIAVVGFAHGTTRSNEFTGGYNYVNTELFIGSNEYTYGTNATAQYANAFQDMSTTQGATNVNNSIGALSALGATQVDLGMNMAEGILNANPLKDQDRNKVVIVFTDGFPSTYSDYSSDVASNAISKASTLKQAGVTVYAIGVFEGADATSSGSSNGDDTQRANWFLQNLSSNNGTPRNPSYYLSAADSDTLTNIFQQISNQIPTGGSSTKLTSDAVIKDIISPAFTLPAGATASNITLETYSCTGKNGDEFTWSQNKTAENTSDTMGASATVNGDQVSVSGFDFAANYVGTETVNGKVSYRGDKLVIKFDVTPNTGFLGGNDVFTNTSAGVYENDKATEPVLTFNRPQVNVPIDDVSVTAANKDVYLLGGVSADEINKTTVTVGGATLNLGSANYGLEAWQNEYVDISVTIKDKNGNEVTKLENLTDDNSYTVSVSVTPKTDGSKGDGTPATAKDVSGTGTVNVYKPVLTFQDSAINAGEIPNYDDASNTRVDRNFVSVEWKHGDDTLPNEGAPELKYSYTPEAEAFTTEQNVKVTVAIDSTNVTPHVTFYRDACDYATCNHKERTSVSATDDARVNFVVHIKTFDLTIQKEGTQEIDENQAYVFHVTGPDDFAMDVVIPGDGSTTIKGLPVGEYTVTEEIGWSWRYSPTNGSATIDADDIINGVATVSFTNNRANKENNYGKWKWLNGCDYKDNAFGAVSSDNSNG